MKQLENAIWLWFQSSFGSICKWVSFKTGGFDSNFPFTLMHSAQFERNNQMSVSSHMTRKTAGTVWHFVSASSKLTSTKPNDQKVIFGEIYILNSRNETKVKVITIICLLSDARCIVLHSNVWLPTISIRMKVEKFRIHLSELETSMQGIKTNCNANGVRVCGFRWQKADNADIGERTRTCENGTTEIFIYNVLTAWSVLFECTSRIPHNLLTFTLVLPHHLRPMLNMLAISVAWMRHLPSAPTHHRAPVIFASFQRHKKNNIHI